MQRLACLGLLSALFVAVGCAADPAEDGADEEVSADGSAYSVSDVPREVNRRVAKCFATDWSQKSIELRTDTRYVSTTTDRVLGAFAVNVVGIAHLLMIGSEGGAVLKTLEDDLREISETQHLNDAQKAAVTACVSGELITYAANGASKILGPAKAAENYEGVCTEYSGIYARLARATGLEASSQFGKLEGGGHAWNWVKVDGKTVWVEPQRNPMRSHFTFIDPQAKAPKLEGGWSCRETGSPVTNEIQCCSGVARSAGDKTICAANPCEKAGTAVCTPNADACSGIAGRATTASCGSSLGGGQCCAF